MGFISYNWLKRKCRKQGCLSRKGLHKGGFVLRIIRFPEGEQIGSGIRSLMFIVAVLLASSLAIAQETSTVINSKPPGVTIRLDGEYKISAITPCRLPDNINGGYRLVASLPGYETWSGDITILPGQDNRFLFTLSPKTRIKAGLRSLFVPGWGQYYAGQKGRAFMLSLATIGFGVGSLVADSDFRKKRDDYLQAQSDLANAVTADEINRLRSLVIDKNREAYNAETTRNTMVAITAGVWAYNILDAIIFFPERKTFFQGTIPERTPRIEAAFDGERVGIKLTASF